MTHPQAAEQPWCCFCVDKNLEDEQAAIRPAVTWVPHLQVFGTAGGTIAGVIALPCCLECRRDQVKGPRSRLLT